MTTPRRTLQMALDALYSGESPPNARQQAAIAALREALAAPEQEPVARCILDNGDEMGSVEWLVRPRSIRLDHGSLLYAAPPAAPAPAALLTGGALDMEETHPSYVAGFKAGHAAGRKRAPAVPLTDTQILSMWKSSEFRGNGGQADWFCEGIRAAEAHHGITGGKK